MDGTGRETDGPAERALILPQTLCPPGVGCGAHGFPVDGTRCPFQRERHGEIKGNSDRTPGGQRRAAEALPRGLIVPLT